MIVKHITRRTVVAAGATGALVGLCAPFVRPARAAAQVIRYATGGGIGPNEMETIIYLDWMQKNVLKGYGKDYTVDMTFTRGTPEAGTLSPPARPTWRRCRSPCSPPRCSRASYPVA